MAFGPNEIPRSSELVRNTSQELERTEVGGICKGVKGMCLVAEARIVVEMDSGFAK